ncbi:transcriptional regulator with XRE-family HTH domain [Saccharopolyspora lacisalsi]|uniref:Transcriptional regulator with XRE-family HTH domain n=1 Tax=Halosaccharopolyspora lacisalsi TaxID=1000566 RepID=A0A839E991_9PSEU|nr:helix-turn-helix transcriptional regulator [Halosaccharopolyspora lacisalsi]MBA8827831.1 transcriptional regulator with XRE-family HTH domain [Halosaccharopolyspora lacisalsi]
MTTQQQRIQELVADYQRRTQQPRLSTRALARQMKSAGQTISHGTLHNLLNGSTSPDLRTRHALTEFFGVSPYYFDTREPRSAEIMGRIGQLEQDKLDAVEQLLSEFDDEAV